MVRPLLVVCCVVSLVHAAQPSPSLVSNARISPDGQSIAFVRQAGPGGQSIGLFRIGFGGQPEGSLGEPGGIVSDLQWSPAGDAIAYISRSAAGAPGVLRIVPAAGGEARTINTSGRDVVAYRWSIDGRRILHESVPQGTPQGERQLNVALVGRAESSAPFPTLARELQPADVMVPIRDATVLFVTPAGERQQSVTLSNGSETWIDLLRADGTRLTVMPPGIARIVSAPSWSLDGTRFAVVGTPGNGAPEIFAGSLPRPQPTGFNMGAVPPMVRQVTGTPR